MTIPPLDYYALRRPRRQLFSEAVNRARKLEQRRRWAAARNRAFSALSRLHPDDFHELYRAALVEIVAERGPLPTDVPSALAAIDAECEEL